MHHSGASLFSPKGILSRSCSRLKCWSTIHRVTFSDSSGRGMTTFCWVLVCVAGVGWGTGTVSEWMECQNHNTVGVHYAISCLKHFHSNQVAIAFTIVYAKKNMHIICFKWSFHVILNNGKEMQTSNIFMKSCSTWEIILIDSKQLKVKKHNTAQ